MVRLLAKTPELGAQTILFAAIDPSLNSISGQFFENNAPVRSRNWQTYNSEIALKLWDVSCQQVHLERASTQ